MEGYLFGGQRVSGVKPILLPTNLGLDEVLCTRSIPLVSSPSPSCNSPLLAHVHTRVHPHLPPSFAPTHSLFSMLDGVHCSCRDAWHPHSHISTPPQKNIKLPPELCAWKISTFVSVGLVALLVLIFKMKLCYCKLKSRAYSRAK